LLGDIHANIPIFESIEYATFDAVLEGSYNVIVDPFSGPDWDPEEWLYLGCNQATHLRTKAAVHSYSLTVPVHRSELEAANRVAIGRAIPLGVGILAALILATVFHLAIHLYRRRKLKKRGCQITSVV